MARAVIRTITAREEVKDYQYVDHQSILLPASSIVIGTGNTQNDGQLYTAADLTFSFANGTGDNGLDSGVEAQDTWYALYAVPKTATTYVLKASINPPPQAGGVGPSGFTKYRYLGLFRNGTNTYDATNGSFGRGDIARFTKVGKRIIWHSLNSTNGGLFPAASGTHGLMVYVANTSTNGIVMDFGNAGNFGFTGNNISGGGVKFPYTAGSYCIEGQVNGTYTNSYMRLTDSAVNDRRYVSMAALVSLTRTPEFLVSRLPNAASATWDEVLRMEISGNPNISRAIFITGMLDPYVMGDK